jgi:hypothetical protein
MSFPFVQARVPDEPRIARFQIYGERCSGTNFLIKLMERNVVSARFTEEFGFKHWFVPDDLRLPEDTLGLLITREPRSWLQSLHEKMWHHPAEVRALSFSDYIRYEWVCVWDDHWLGIGPDDPLWMTEMMHERHPVTGERVSGPLEMRALKARNMTKLGDRSPAFAVLRSEDLQRDPRGFLDALAVWSIERGPYVAIDSYKGDGHKPYVPKERPPLSAEDEAFVRPRLDSETETLLGYT